MTAGISPDTVGHLLTPPETAATQALYADDVEQMGFVMNASRLWAYQPAVHDELFALMSKTLADQGISFRQRGIVVAACASTLGDSYCSIAWGSKLAAVSDDELAAAVIRGDDAGLTDDERALAAWARRVASDPNATTADDVQQLRDSGFTDQQIFAVTVFIALRIGFSTVNDALGVGPDAAYRTKAPSPVRDAITFGRPLDA